MTIDEAIKHCLEVAEQNETQAEMIGRQLIGSAIDKYITNCRKCAAEHRQLAEWLTELKELRSIVDACNILAVDAFAVEKLCKELKEAKRLLKAAVEDFRIVGTMLEDGHGHCTAEISCDECMLGGGNLADDCQWRHEAEALKLIEKGEQNCGR